MTHIRSVLLVVAAFAVLLAGCAGSVATASPTIPSPTPSPTPSPVPSSPAPSPTTVPVPVPVTTPEQAVARILAIEPRLAGIKPFDSDLIGQASWYKVTPASGVGAFVVEVRVGWGDCPSGCIDEHRWIYAVAPDGTVTLGSETGQPVPGREWPAPGVVGRTGIGGTATAGPICPVEKIPPDPACAPRPVAGAVVVIRAASGAEVARTTTGADGTFFADVAPGGYIVEPQAMEGLMGKPGPQDVTVSEGITTTVDLAYDTGIR